MITLDQVLHEQKNLASLCTPRTEHCHELYRPNDNYGLAYILKSYAGYPIDKPIMATIPHGIYFRDKVLPNSEINAPLPAVLSYPGYITQLWKKFAKKKAVIPIASPVLYALKMFQSEVPEEERQGTLFMPKHSTAAVDVIFDKEAVIRELEDLPDEFKPVTVCVHWNDVINGQDRYFKSMGFEVVCAGHMSDFNYLFRWLHLLSRHKLAAHCGLGSALFYSVSAGVPFLLTRQDATTKQNGRAAHIKMFNKDGPHYSGKAMARMDKLRGLFSTPSSIISQPQEGIVNLYTQKDMVKSPEALNSDLCHLQKLAR